MRSKKSFKVFNGSIVKFPTRKRITLFPTKKSIVKSAIWHILMVLLATVIIVSAILINVNATGTDAVITPLNSLKTLVIAIIGAVGIIILAKNVMEFAQAYQQQDSSTMNSALKGIVAGLLMAGISAVLGFLGF